MKTTLFVPDSLSAELALFKMQASQLPLLYVVNEFGSVTGMVTLEDIAEELVGDILLIEQSNKKEMFTQLEIGEFLIDAAFTIDDFNSYFHTNIEKDGYETLGGFLQKKMSGIPEVDEKYRIEYGLFQVFEADHKSINKIKYFIN